MSGAGSVVRYHQSPPKINSPERYIPAYIRAILWRNAETPSSRSCPQLLLTRALSGAPSEAIDMLGLSRAFLSPLIATVALLVIGLARQQDYRSVYFADARTGWGKPERL